MTTSERNAGAALADAVQDYLAVLADPENGPGGEASYGAKMAYELQRYRAAHSEQVWHAVELQAGDWSEDAARKAIAEYIEGMR